MILRCWKRHKAKQVRAALLRSLGHRPVFERMGVVLSRRISGRGWTLHFSPSRGLMYGWPHWLQQLLIRPALMLGCFLWDHDLISEHTRPQLGGSICVECCKKFPS